MSSVRETSVSVCHVSDDSTEEFPETLNISLTNSGEDSYMTNMALNYPRNLQFKKIQKVLVTDLGNMLQCLFLACLPDSIPWPTASFCSVQYRNSN